MTTDLRGYNERLFSGGVRGKVHTSRYRWLVREIRQVSCMPLRIVELGCFDGKSIAFLESAGLTVHEYHGFDANWEGGLELGREHWRNRREIYLHACEKPEEMQLAEKNANIGICMETFEHLPEDLVEPYIARLAKIIQGYLFVSVPMERGVMFLARHLAKRAMRMEDYPFTAAEFWHAIWGNMSQVQRDGHKGFDDRVLVRQLAQRFDIVKVCGIFPGLPGRTWNFNLGIVARSRR